MKLPKLQKPDRYVGLYIFDFGDHAGVGFTAEEVAELLDSEKYKNGKVYKIHRAYPDGRLELKGVRAETFHLEAGMFFYSADLETAQKDFKSLVDLAVKAAPPCRAKVHLAKYTDLPSPAEAGFHPPQCYGGRDAKAGDKFVVAIIYPAEHDDQVSSWLLGGNYRTSGETLGGTGAVQRYYNEAPEILDRHQLFGKSEIISRTGEELLASVKLAVQR